MNQVSHKLHNLRLRKRRVRANVSGTSERPRLSVFISNRHVSAQIIDDTKHVTIASVTTVGQKGIEDNLTQKALWAGEAIAKKAKSAKIKCVVFDRGGRLYHGRVQALADAARKAGLEF